MQMIQKAMVRMCRSTVLCLGLSALAACAHFSEREAVSNIKRKQGAIPYNDDVKTGSNRSSFGFRSLPERTETAAVTEQSGKSVAEVSQCLQTQLQSQFKLPENFFQVRSYANNAQSVTLVNPFTKKTGLLMEVAERGVNRSEVKLYANGATLSSAWKRLPGRCR